jgi:hypothetical protein
MECPFNKKIHCLYLEEARDHGFLLYPDCPSCSHYEEEPLDPPQYVGWRAYAILIGGIVGMVCFICALIYVGYNAIFIW